MPGLAPAQGLNDSAETLDGYRSPMHGRRPLLRECATSDAELNELAQQVRRWLDAGVEPGSIGVAARYKKLAQKAAERLGADGIKTISVGGKSAGVQVGSMHAMKGMEFRCVAVIGVREGTLPLGGVVTSEEEDPRAHNQDMQKERCLLFVACTRARDHLYVSYAGRPSSFLRAG
ncbi:3'-5' exonuclease [Actinomadura macrotermitis]|uniref:ATP-dependent DNA helicase Rep n=1 Tax=Actinomadura macrotermitis TaxID=2585200 RepID=A0A7K0C9M3_9ACTN|nr:3'-5' exonuclease [Actinomadura macrotermitis]MQY09474.1 ATP-dependent DNA helicase Rep [Actinomadura macrotermitis]